jgi:hypothetical protein
MREKTNRITWWKNKGKYFSDAGFCFLFTKNKVLESIVTFQKKPTEWFRVCCQATRNISQPGFCAHITLLWCSLEILLYDKRQWNYKKNRFINETAEFKYF